MKTIGLIALTLVGLVGCKFSPSKSGRLQSQTSSSYKQKHVGDVIENFQVKTVAEPSQPFELQSALSDAHVVVLYFTEFALDKDMSEFALVRQKYPQFKFKFIAINQNGMDVSKAQAFAARNPDWIVVNDIDPSNAPSSLGKVTTTVTGQYIPNVFLPVNLFVLNRRGHVSFHGNYPGISQEKVEHALSEAAH